MLTQVTACHRNLIQTYLPKVIFQIFVGDLESISFLKSFNITYFKLNAHEKPQVQTYYIKLNILNRHKYIAEIF